ncbi:protein nlrc3 [Stylonychia lemnae]|uniref:Protein nlrc3 n=1 Tax=Stylonychia lemnae TaxID=5949 RepID=A0A078AZB8_STYLE|nr:protein nlrc3 [Stylonychia lemnae]|eukprot:CDW86158.1 protein nlrc3 [Stylonychia lemnae]
MEPLNQINTDADQPRSAPSLLAKSKYCFFNILSYYYSRAEAKMLLKRLSQRGRDLCQDTYLNLLKPLAYNLEIRSPQQIIVLHRFTNNFFFDDEIQLELYLDFNRLEERTVISLIKAIQDCSNIAILKVAGSPNPVFAHNLFEMLGTNKTIKEIDVNIEFFKPNNFLVLQHSLSKNSILEKISLRKCSVSNTDIELIVRGMNSNPSRPIKAFELHDIILPSQSIKALTSYLSEIDPKSFKEFSLSFVQNVDSDDLTLMLSKNQNLEKVHIRSCFFDKNLSLHNLKDHRNIQELLISNINIDSTLIQNLALTINETLIKKLIIDSCKGSIQDFAWVKLGNQIGQSQTLTHLEISNFASNNLHFLTAGIVQNKSLWTLIIEQCKLQTIALAPITNLVSQNKNLRTLKLGHNNFTNTLELLQLSKALALNQSILELDLNSNQHIPMEFYNFLQVNQSLRYLRMAMQSNHLQILLSILKDNHGLQSIDLMQTRFSYQQIEEIEKLKHVKIYYYDDKM